MRKFWDRHGEIICQTATAIVFMPLVLFGLFATVNYAVFANRILGHPVYDGSHPLFFYVTAGTLTAFVLGAWLTNKIAEHFSYKRFLRGQPASISA